MKRILCIAVAIIPHLFTLAQADSLKFSTDSNLIGKDSGMLLQSSNPVKQKIYTLKPAVDIPVFAAGAGWSGYAFTKIYSKDKSSEAKILSLDVNDINGFDRWAVRPHSEKIR